VKNVLKQKGIIWIAAPFFEKKLGEIGVYRNMQEG
jgi:hypothetical protein